MRDLSQSVMSKKDLNYMATGGQEVNPYLFFFLLNVPNFMLVLL